MKSVNRPSWVTKYEEVGLPTGWADEVLDKHSDQLLEKSGNSLSPVKYTDIDILELDQEPMDQFPDPSDETTFIETVLAVFDFLSAFARNIPDSDSEIHTLYQKIRYNERFEEQFDFPDFYRFCRQIQYNKIHKLAEYQRLQKTYENYIDTVEPETGSRWIVEYKSLRCELLVQGEGSRISDDTVDPTMYGQVTDIISDGDGVVELGEFVSVPINGFIEKV